jgi:hypothetical protein
VNWTRNWKVVAAAVAVFAVAGAGGALAATRLFTPAEQSKAVIDDAAKQLGVQPSALTDALKKALEKQVDAEVAAGRLTKEQGDALKQRIASGEYPLLGVGLGGLRPFGFGSHHGFGAGLDSAASYLGVTADALRTELENGKTLAQVAKEKGKSVDGLVDALTADATSTLDAAVADGRLTRTQADDLLARVREHVRDAVNGTGPAHDFRFRFRGGPGVLGAGAPVGRSAAVGGATSLGSRAVAQARSSSR